MKSTIRFSAFSLLFVILLPSALQAQGPDKPTHNYKILWNRFDSLTNLSLMESAQKLADSVYTLAKAENNQVQVYKSLLKKGEASARFQDEPVVATLALISKEISIAPQPLQQLLWSAHGSILWSYYQNNYYKLRNLTPLDVEEEDLLTWDAKTLLNQIEKSFLASLENPGLLKKTATDNISDILEGDSTYRELRPTLYDILAHRLVNFYLNARNYTYISPDPFTVSDPHWFDTYRYKTMQDTSSSFNYKALVLYNDLITLNTENWHEDAVIQLHTDRLELVKSVYTGDDAFGQYTTALDNLAKGYAKNSYSANVLFQLAVSYYQLDADSGYRKAMLFAERIIDMYPGHKLAEDARKMIDKIRQPSFTVKSEGYVSTGREFPVFVEYKNMTSLFISVYKADPVNWEIIKNIGYARDYRNDILIDTLPYMTAVKNIVHPLPASGDYGKHSGEFIMPALEPGYYVIRFSDIAAPTSKNGQANIIEVWATDISWKSRENAEETTEIMVVNRNTGKPLKGASVTVYNKGQYRPTDASALKVATRGKTNESGIANLNDLKDVNYSYHLLEITHKKQRITYNNFYPSSGYYAGDNDDDEPRIFFFLDRKIYRPGQTVYYKVLLTSHDRQKVIADTTIDIDVYDANGQDLVSVELKTNKFGTASGSFVIPQNVATGTMYIDSDFGEEYFQVEEYKRPKFEVTLTADSASFKLGDTIVMKGKAVALGGFNITDAKVSYTVTRETYVPYWFSIYKYSPFRWDYNSSKAVLLNGETITDANGEFEVRFVAAPDPAIKEGSYISYYFNTSADVTDLTGETRSNSDAIKLGYRKWEFNTSITDLVKGDTADLPLSITDMKGREQTATVTYEIYEVAGSKRLQRTRLWGAPDTAFYKRDEFYARLPHDIFMNDDLTFSQKGQRIGSGNFALQAGKRIKQSALGKLNQGKYIVVFTTKDPDGKELTAEVPFTVYDIEKPVAFADEYFYSFSLDPNPEKGDNIRIFAGSGASEFWVRAEVEKGGEIIASKWLNIGKKQSVLVFDVLNETGLYTVYLTATCNGRNYNAQYRYIITDPAQQLDVKLVTFRDNMLPGSREDWKLQVKSATGNTMPQTEILASMYDAALDVFATNTWNLPADPYQYSLLGWGRNYTEALANLYPFNPLPGYYPYLQRKNFEDLSVMGLTSSYYLYDKLSRVAGVYSVNAEVANMADGVKVRNEDEKELKELESFAVEDGKYDQTGSAEQTTGETNIRRNFNETAFFYPHLETNDKGEVSFSFTIPEAITRWNFRAFAHNALMQYGFTGKEVTTSKKLMVNSFPPRFLRENDQVVYSAKVTNTSAETLAGESAFQVSDPFTGKSLNELLKLKDIIRTFSLKPGESTTLEWTFAVPAGYDVLTTRVIADARSHSDGEEYTLAVLKNSILVTESMPVSANGKGVFTYNFKSFKQQAGQVQKNQSLTLEYTSNPAWYAIQSMPYLLEYPYECAEQLFSRLYANALGAHILAENPVIQKVYDAWKKDGNGTSLLSALEKNPELKTMLLEETPWVREAKDETEQKRRLAQLFEQDQVEQELRVTTRKLTEMQTGAGGWPWFTGGNDDPYITLHILSGLKKLQTLGITRYTEPNVLRYNYAIDFIDLWADRQYKLLKNDTAQFRTYFPSSAIIEYLYVRQQYLGDKVLGNYKEAYDFFTGKARQHWNKLSSYNKAVLATFFHRSGETDISGKIMAGLKQSAVKDPEMGTYWKEGSGLSWYDAPIETHCRIIEAFHATGATSADLTPMQTWLIKNKQTNHWPTTRSTTDAIYALLIDGTQWLNTQSEVGIQLGNTSIDPAADPSIKLEAATGYFKKTYTGSDITTDKGDLKIYKNNEGPSYGALYWQYFQKPEDVKQASNEVSIKREIYVERKTATGPVLTAVTDDTRLQTGDRVVIRLVIMTDRALDYVHIKDSRASAFEPENVLSGYRYSGGLGYYESTRDASTNFFVNSMPKGTYVLEYACRITHTGDYSAGLATMQCMYAPEFTVHSKGRRIKISGK